MGSGNRPGHPALSEYINTDMKLETFLSPMECLLSDFFGEPWKPEIFMVPYRSQEEPKNEFWLCSRKFQVENGTLLQWSLITRYPIIWGPGQSRGNLGA